MKSEDKLKWKEAVEEEYMVKYNVFKLLPIDEVDKNATVLSSKWVLKKMANGTHYVHITAKGWEQIDGEHYDEHSITAPVVDDMTIHVILVLTVMARWIPQLVDVKGSFLHREFEEKHKMYMKVPQGFGRWYGRECFCSF